MVRGLCAWLGGGRRAATPIALGLAFLLSACGVGGPAYGPPSEDVAATVAMTTGFSFIPPEVTVRVGDTVEWRNKSVFTHTVTTDPTLVADPAHVAVPEGALVFDSGAVFPGNVFRHTFKAPGTYRYTCVPHENFRMHGKVIVEPGG